MSEEILDARAAANLVAQLMRDTSHAAVRHHATRNRIGIVHSTVGPTIELDGQILRRSSFRIARTVQMGALQPGDEVLLTPDAHGVFTVSAHLRDPGDDSDDMTLVGDLDVTGVVTVTGPFNASSVHSDGSLTVLGPTTLSDTLSGADVSLTGGVSGTTGTFSGAVGGASGTFSGAVSAGSISTTSLSVSTLTASVSATTVALTATGLTQLQGNTQIGDANTDLIGFWGAARVAQSTGWSVTNVSTDKVFDANATTIAEIADVLGTLINQLKTYGILGA